MSKQLGRDYEHVLAIVRVDHCQDSSVPDKNKITVTKIVRTDSEAKTEVERLNAVNAEKHCTYFWRITRLMNS